MRAALQRHILSLLLSTLFLSACALRAPCDCVGRAAQFNGPLPSLPTDGLVVSTARGAQLHVALVEYARQANIPVLALNIPRSLARRVSKEGLQAVVQSVPNAERAPLPATF